MKNYSNKIFFGREDIIDENIKEANEDSKELEEKPWKDYKLHLVVLVIVIIAEWIGKREIHLSDSVSLIIMPLLYSMVLGLALVLSKRFKWISLKQSRIAEASMLLFIGPLLCKLAVSSGQSIQLLFDVGPALILQEFGNLGTIFFALPIALLLGYKRETIGMTNSIGREPNVAVVIDKYGFNSPETRGVLMIFIVGTVIGTLYISFLSSICVSALPLHPYAFAMASGVGSASLNAAALAPILAYFPELTLNIEAFAGFSNLLSFCVGIYLCIFVAIPLAEKLYNFLEPKIGRTRSDLKNIKENDDKEMK